MPFNGDINGVSKERSSRSNISMDVCNISTIYIKEQYVKIKENK